MTLTQKSTHVQEGLANLVQQFKDKPDLAALLTSYLEQIQDLETAYFGLLTERTLNAAVGVQLDGIGAIVGEDRRGRDDADYRLAIRARIKASTPAGREG